MDLFGRKRRKRERTQRAREALDRYSRVKQMRREIEKEAAPGAQERVEKIRRLQDDQMTTTNPVYMDQFTVLDGNRPLDFGKDAPSDPPSDFASDSSSSGSDYSSGSDSGGGFDGGGGGFDG